MNDLKGKIKDHIEREYLMAEPIGTDENLLLSGRLDSLAVMGLVAFLEQEFDIAVPFDEVLIENFESVDALAVFVTTKQAAT